MNNEYKNIYKKVKSREEFVGTLLLSDWEMPRATAISLWAELSASKKKRGTPKKIFDFEPEAIYGKHDNFPESEKNQPGVMKWMEFKDMCKFIKDRTKLTRSELLKYGFNRNEINWLMDEGYIKYGGGY